MTRMHVYLLAIVGALLLGAGLSFVFLRDQPGEESEPSAPNATFDGPPSDSLEDVLRLTDLVLVATFDAERRAEVEQPPPGGASPEGAQLIRENLTRWTFAVDEVLAGDYAQPQVQVIFARSLGLPGPGDEYMTVSWDVPELQEGEQYVLFLSDLDTPAHYPDAWTGRSFGLAVAGVGEISGSSFLLEYADLDDLNGEGEKLTLEGTLESLPVAWESALSAARTHSTTHPTQSPAITMEDRENAFQAAVDCIEDAGYEVTVYPGEGLRLSTYSVAIPEVAGRPSSIADSTVRECQQRHTAPVERAWRSQRGDLTSAELEALIGRLESCVASKPGDDVSSPVGVVFVDYPQLRDNPISVDRSDLAKYSHCALAEEAQSGWKAPLPWSDFGSLDWLSDTSAEQEE